MSEVGRSTNRVKSREKRDRNEDPNLVRRFSDFLAILDGFLEAFGEAFGRILDGGF